MTPLQHLWADGGGDEQPVLWSIAWTGLGSLGLSYYRVKSPGDNTHHSGGGKDGVQHLWDFPSELTGESISPDGAKRKFRQEDNGSIHSCFSISSPYSFPLGVS